MPRKKMGEKKGPEKKEKLRGEKCFRRETVKGKKGSHVTSTDAFPSGVPPCCALLLLLHLPRLEKGEEETAGNSTPVTPLTTNHDFRDLFIHSAMIVSIMSSVPSLSFRPPFFKMRNQRKCVINFEGGG